MNSDDDCLVEEEFLIKSTPQNNDENDMIDDLKEAVDKGEDKVTAMIRIRAEWAARDWKPKNSALDPPAQIDTVTLMNNISDCLAEERELDEVHDEKELDEVHDKLWTDCQGGARDSL